MSAIRLKVKKAEGKHDLGTSKFLGSPTLPEEMVNEFNGNVLFLLQINLEEIKDLDKENRLPHHGYLYVFLDTTDDYNLVPIVRYYDGEPTCVVGDFNSTVPEFEQFVDEWLISFSECEDSETGNKLFGCPADWNYQEEPRELFLQFDPLDSEMGLFDYFDGLLYLFYAEGSKKLEDITAEWEIS